MNEPLAGQQHISLRSKEDLESFRSRLLSRPDKAETVIRVCDTGCRARRSAKVVEALESELLSRNLGGRVRIARTGCHGFCEMGPVLVLDPENIFYSKVRPEDVPEIISETVLKGVTLDRLLWKHPDTGQVYRTERELPFYSGQKKVVSGNTGRIDPLSIDDYIKAGGYSALGLALHSMKPAEVLETVVRSGLRGRGGGGFSSGMKWRIAAQAPGNEKYIVANGDEGDPGAFMDRSLMEGDPYGILEGMCLGGYAIGAGTGYIYVREEYPIAIQHMTNAIREARSRGLLGADILGSGFSLDIHISRGAGAFVCGEETALIISIEGRSGTPRPRPPYPALQGLWGRPTVLNNVETFANIPHIIGNGAEWFSGLGTDRSKGTKIFSLVGKVRNTGLVEVEMGTTLRQIIFDIGGGTRKNRAFKAVQTGGPSGGCIPASRLDLSVDYDSLKEVGAIMGSGGMIVMDDTSCMVDVARYFIRFLMYESCGKCTPCREGLKQMYAILENICEGRGRPDDVNRLMELGQFMTRGSLCGLGATAPNPVLSTLRHFRNEYESHITDGKCRAGVCKRLFEYRIDENLCVGCTVCARKCPENAISGEKKKPHLIDTARCIKCGICFSVCKEEAVRVC